MTPAPSRTEPGRAARLIQQIRSKGYTTDDLIAQVPELVREGNALRGQVAAAIEQQIREAPELRTPAPRRAEPDRAEPPR